jgi:hypothetical protein
MRLAGDTIPNALDVVDEAAARPMSPEFAPAALARSDRSPCEGTPA